MMRVGWTTTDARSSIVADAIVTARLGEGRARSFETGLRLSAGFLDRGGLHSWLQQSSPLHASRASLTTNQTMPSDVTGMATAATIRPESTTTHPITDR